MAETLVIVESPSKAKTIEKYLGSKYRVIASNGHVRDLPKSQLGVDVEHDFEPKYITLRGRGELYTILTNRDKHGRKGTIVAIVKGTKAEDVINVLRLKTLIRQNVVRISFFT